MFLLQSNKTNIKNIKSNHLEEHIQSQLTAIYTTSKHNVITYANEPSSTPDPEETGYKYKCICTISLEDNARIHGNLNGLVRAT